jgi:hypothetical protein
VTTSVVIGSVFLTADQEFRVEKLSVIASADLVDGRGIEVDKDGTRHILSTARLGEHSIKLTRVVKSLGIRVRATILLEAMLKKVSVFISCELAVRC